MKFLHSGRAISAIQSSVEVSPFGSGNQFDVGGFLIYWISAFRLNNFEIAKFMAWLEAVWQSKRLEVLGSKENLGLLALWLGVLVYGVPCGTQNSRLAHLSRHLWQWVPRFLQTKNQQWLMSQQASFASSNARWTLLAGRTATQCTPAKVQVRWEKGSNDFQQVMNLRS